MNLAESVEILKVTPGLLRTWLANLSSAWVHCDTGPDTFSPFDVVGHLIHGERTDWMVRLRLILEHGTSRPFERFDRLAMYEESRGKTLAMLLDEFAALRDRNLRELIGLKLTSADLQKEGMHPDLGKVTVSQLIATWVAHDLNHIDQIARTMANRHREAVGPWRAYLSVLNR